MSDSTVTAFVPKGRGSNNPKVMLRAAVVEKPRSLPSNLRPVAAHDAAGDEVRMRWTFVIIAVDGLADIHLESLHFSTLNSTEKLSKAIVKGRTASPRVELVNSSAETTSFFTAVPHPIRASWPFCSPVTTAISRPLLTHLAPPCDPRTPREHPQ